MAARHPAGDIAQREDNQQRACLWTDSRRISCSPFFLRQERFDAILRVLQPGIRVRGTQLFDGINKDNPLMRAESIRPG